MNRTDNKRNVFNTIKTYNSMNQTYKTKKESDSMKSINNDKNSIIFLIDTLKVLAGAGALKILIGSMLTKLLKNTEKDVKVSMKKQFTQSNASEPLPNNFTNNGINVNVNKIDTSGKLKVSPNSIENGGNLIYGQPNSNNFDYNAYNAIQSEGTPVNCNNLKLQYNSATDSFNIKPNGTSSNINSFFNAYIDNAQIINSDEIVSNTMDRIFGTLSSQQNKTPDSILNELIIEKLLNQVLEGNYSFEISSNDLNDLQDLAYQLSNGVVGLDLGCGYMPASLSIQDLNNLINAISRNSNPFEVANALETALDNSLTNNTDKANQNKETIKDNYFQSIINNLIVKVFVAITTAPQIRTLQGISSSFQNNGQAMIDDTKNDMKKWKTFIICMGKQILMMFSKFIFDLILVYLVKLISKIQKKVIKEKIESFKKIIKSLIKNESG